MPATDISWSLNEKPPIFQVYGTKRKCSSLPTDATDQVEECPKRRCLEVNSMHTDWNIAETQHTPDHGFLRCLPQQLCTAQSQQPVCSPLIPHGDCLSSQNTLQENNNNSLPSLQPQVFLTQSQHMAESGDSIAGYPPDSVVRHEMENNVRQKGDCGTETNMEAEDIPMQQQQGGLAFCDNFCVGGDLSPRSQRVRCCCIPSWEGLLDSRQYMSDYY